MPIMFVSHEVSDYDKWKNALDQSPAINGLQEMKIYRSTSGHRVVVSHIFDTMANADKHREFLENPENRHIAEELGVIYPITNWIVEEA